MYVIIKLSVGCDLRKYCEVLLLLLLLFLTFSVLVANPKKTTYFIYYCSMKSFDKTVARSRSKNFYIYMLYLLIP